MDIYSNLIRFIYRYTGSFLFISVYPYLIFYSNLFLFIPIFSWFIKLVSDLFIIFRSFTLIPIYSICSIYPYSFRFIYYIFTIYSSLLTFSLFILINSNLFTTIPIYSDLILFGLGNVIFILMYLICLLFIRFISNSFHIQAYSVLFIHIFVCQFGFFNSFWFITFMPIHYDLF